MDNSMTITVGWIWPVFTVWQCLPCSPGELRTLTTGQSGLTNCLFNMFLLSGMTVPTTQQNFERKTLQLGTQSFKQKKPKENAPSLHDCLLFSLSHTTSCPSLLKPYLQNNVYNTINTTKYGNQQRLLSVERKGFRLILKSVHLLITALSSGNLNTLGLSLPSCGSGVTDPTSTNPKPIFNNPSTASPCLSKPAAMPTGFLNVRPQSLISCTQKSKWKISNFELCPTATMNAQFAWAAEDIVTMQRNQKSCVTSYQARFVFELLAWKHPIFHCFHSNDVGCFCTQEPERRHHKLSVEFLMSRGSHISSCQKTATGHNQHAWAQFVLQMTRNSKILVATLSPPGCWNSLSYSGEQKKGFNGPVVRFQVKCGVTWIELTLLEPGQMNGQRHSDNQGPEWMVVHWSTRWIEINHCIHNLGWQGLHPHLLTAKVNFPHNLLFYERPRFNLDCIHGWVTRKRGKNPDHVTSPWGGRRECWVIASKIAEFWY